MSSSTIAVQEAAAQDVRRWLHAGEAVLVDVREPDEHAREHIGGAQLVPLSRFDAARVAAMAKPGQRIVMQCRSGKRAADACRMALESAATAHLPIYTLSGGIEGWKNAQLPVEVDTRVSSLSVMRQVQLVIGAGVLLGSALAWLVDPLFIGIPAFFGAGLVFAGATGTCGLASLLGMMPWNRAGAGGGTCATGRCN